MEENLQTPKPKMDIYELTKWDNAFAIGGVITSIFAAVFGIFGGYALGYAVSSVLMLLLFMTYFAKGGKVRAFSVLCGLLAFANAAVFVFTGNGSVRFFGVLVSFLLALACYDGLIYGKVSGNRQTLFLYVKSLSTVGGIAKTFRSLLSGGKGNGWKFAKVLLGLACAVPVLVVVVPLLVLSDDAFSGMLQRMFSDSFTTACKTIFGLLMSIFVISYGITMKKGKTCDYTESRFKGIDSVYIVSFLSAIALCYLLYLFSQLAYFFSAFKGFLPNGEITYAQYARKGFFEMCIIAVINLSIVFVALLLAKKENGKAGFGVKLLTTFICVFTLIIISTAISKMVLYIGQYGMTVLRLTTSAFMVFLGVVFISVILRIYMRRINIIKTALLAAGCIVLLLGVANVNQVCAVYNYESYRTGRLESVDVKAMYRLGHEGIPYVVKLAGDEDQAVADEAKYYLAKAYLRDYFADMQTMDAFTLEQLQENEKDSALSKFSLPKAAAYDALYTYLEENPEFSAQCRQLLYG